MIRRLGRALDEHWFGPLPGFYLSLARVVVFGGTLFFLLDPFPFGEPAQLVRQHWLTGMDGTLYLPIPALNALLLPFGPWGTVRPGPDLLRAAWFIAVVAAFASALGIRARLFMLPCAVTTTLLYAHGYSYQEFHHPEAALVIALWVLALAPVARPVSRHGFVARIREAVRTRRFRPRLSEADAQPVIRWPLRLIQWVMVLIYLSAGISKLVHGGFDWVNGHTLAYYFVQDGVRWFDGGGPGMWLAQHVSIASVLSVGALAFELTFMLAVLFPRVAWVYVAGGTALHIGIYIVQHAPFFQFIVLYVVFAEAVYGAIKAAPAVTRRMIEAVRPLVGREARNAAT